MSDPNENREMPESCRINLPAPEEDHGFPQLSSLDRLDKAAMSALGLLLLAALAIVLMQPGETGRPHGISGTGRQNVLVINPELDKKLALAVTLMNGGDSERVDSLLDSLIAEFPYEGGPHLLKGDLFLRRQQPVAAMLEYRQAVDLNPDYLDKKMTEIFQGKKIKNTLEEARTAIDADLAAHPGEGKLRQQREVLYYMLRKVAGSCG